MRKVFFTYKKRKTNGYALYTAIILTGALILVAYATADLSIKESQLSSDAADSHVAFYNADSGLECAVYWDTKAGQTSAFDTGGLSPLGEIFLNEYSGVDPVLALDETSGMSGISTGVPNQHISSGFQNTNYAHELIFGHGETAGNGPADPGPGFTIRSNVSNDVTEDTISGGAGSYDANFTYENPFGVQDGWLAKLATFKPALGQTISFVQANGGLGIPPSFRSLSFNSPSNTGDLIVVTFAYAVPDFSISSVTDSAGNTYARAGNPTNGTFGGQAWRTEIWYAKNIVTNSSPLTVTVNSPATTPASINCNGQTISTDSQTVDTTPPQQSQIGGGGSGSPTSIFQLNFPTGCAIVTVTKNTDGTTLIQSHGYNSCSGDNRLERGIEIQY